MTKKAPLAVLPNVPSDLVLICGSSLLAFAIHLPSETTAQAVAKPLATPTVSQLVRTAKMFELKSNQKLTDIELFEKLGLPPSSVELRGFSSSLCLLYTSPSPRDRTRSRMPSSA